MKKYRKVFSSIFSVMVLFVLILFSQDSLLFGTNSNKLVELYRYGFIFVFLISSYSYMFLKRRIIFFDFRLILIFTLFILLTVILNYDFRTGYVFKLMLFFYAFIITKIFSLNQFINSFKNLMVFVSFFSVLIYILTIISKDLLYIFNPNEIINTANITYYNFFGFVVPKEYFTNIIDLQISIPRNFGIFREPGVFQVYTLYALSINLYYYRKIRFFETFILTVSILTTLSTAGYIVLALIFAYLPLKVYKLKSDKNKVLFFYFFLIILIIFISSSNDFIFGDYYGSVFSKIYDLFGRESSLSRIASIYSNFLVFLRSPLYGVGLSNAETYFLTTSFEVFNVNIVDNTNTIMLSFSTFGIFFGLLFIYRLFLNSTFIANSNINKFFIFSIILLIFFSQNLSFSLFPHLLIFITTRSNII